MADNGGVAISTLKKEITSTVGDIKGATPTKSCHAHEPLARGLVLLLRCQYASFEASIAFRRQMKWAAAAVSILWLLLQNLDKIIPLIKHLFSVCVVSLVLFSCVGCSLFSRAVGATLGQGNLVAIKEGVAREANALEVIAKSKPITSAAVEASAASLRDLESRLDNAVEEYADLDEALAAKDKRIEKLRNESRQKGSWIFMAGIGLGILGIAGSVYACIQSFSLKTLGLTAASFVLAGVSVGFLWYGHIIALVILGALALVVLAIVVLIALNWKSVLRRTTEAFDQAEALVMTGTGVENPLVSTVKQQWAILQQDKGIKKKIDKLRHT